MENEILNEDSRQTAPEMSEGTKKCGGKWWIWLIVAVLLAGIAFGAVTVIDNYIEVKKAEAFNAEANRCISIVKNTALSDAGHTYGEVFDGYYSRHCDPQWSYLGEGVVEFQGSSDVYQFEVDIGAGKLVSMSLTIDGEVQSWLMVRSHTQVTYDLYVYGLMNGK